MREEALLEKESSAARSETQVTAEEGLAARNQTARAKLSDADAARSAAVEARSTEAAHRHGVAMGSHTEDREEVPWT